ncbi:NADH:ubiquinone reductase (Na(+)-transporting) subunit D [bacterium]|nr:NADH:ubiquinone reductase (Na(+)-transporting) subunit D [bacterium]MBT4249125.1 NADH:ubiquinone reductase (Na(+)-transporting) subunit D [bacterium]MBT6017694.1 NADH:ubiquinone reductase (Na(+)-transporting) subunit D [bacterium]MBT6777754.1 NADH:ubiquinone reductase (Na(+)-transporting) subunit D [bacterium]
MGENPISIHVLGICSALAITTKIDTAVVMTIAVVAVLSISNVVISLLRNNIPNKVRIIIQMSVIASLVIIADQVLKAYMYDMSKLLGVFLGLIITNCIVLGRAEAYAMQNSPSKALLDGMGNGLGYGTILIAVAFFRELFGFGSIYGAQVITNQIYLGGYENNGLMILSPGAFFILGLIVWAHRAYTETSDKD